MKKIKAPARKAPKKKSAKPSKKTHDREYHLVWNGERGRYDVETDDGRSIAFHDNQGGAIARAIQAAHADHAEGIDAVVCVQQKDGGWKMGWHGLA